MGAPPQQLLLAGSKEKLVTQMLMPQSGSVGISPQIVEAIA